MLLDVAVCLPREAETVGLIRNVVKNALRSFGATEECTDDVCLALTEACTNVIDHAVHDDEYEVRVQIDEQNCAISVRNTGQGFDAAALCTAMPDPTSREGVASPSCERSWTRSTSAPERNPGRSSTWSRPSPSSPMASSADCAEDDQAINSPEVVRDRAWHASADDRRRRIQSVPQRRYRPRRLPDRSGRRGLEGGDDHPHERARSRSAGTPPSRFRSNRPRHRSVEVHRGTGCSGSGSEPK